MNSFFEILCYGKHKIDLYGIAHVKVEFILVLKIYTIQILGRFVWSTHFVQCAHCAQSVKSTTKKFIQICGVRRFYKRLDSRFSHKKNSLLYEVTFSGSSKVFMSFFMHVKLDTLYNFVVLSPQLFKFLPICTTFDSMKWWRGDFRKLSPKLSS